MILKDLFKSTSNALANTIAECKPYLSIPGAKTGFLYRGMRLTELKYNTDKVTTPTGNLKISWLRLKRKTKRAPSATDSVISSAADNFFNETFGWRCRSSGVFATGVEADSNVYGDKHIILPIGPTRFVWSTVVRDMYAASTHFIYKNGKDKSRSEVVDMFVDYLAAAKYRDTDLGQAIDYGSEIMLDCDEYLVILLEGDSTRTESANIRRYLKDKTGIS